ncbi:MAG TPA: hypothetical protein VED59_09275, partial [Acidimicrobiales bacterium]|nr:hypothetical protein [Acidimicrobiales bacterium]
PNAEPAPTAGITHLLLAAEEVIPFGECQLALWGGPSGADRRAIRGLDRLRGMLGPRAVFTAALGGGRSPRERVILVPWGEQAPTPAAAPWPGCHPLPAPALVHPSPIPAEVTDSDGMAVTVSARGRLNASPTRISISGGPWQTISDWAGPWTTDQRWWDPRIRKRRASFQFLTDSQLAHLCVVEGGRWWVEATYA